MSVDAHTKDPTRETTKNTRKNTHNEKERHTKIYPGSGPSSGGNIRTPTLSDYLWVFPGYNTALI